ncbi:MAG: porin [Rickettsiales bacterium]|nr:porin [Rickettsiales bacterium]
MLKLSTLAATSLMLTSSFAYAADTLPSKAELWKMIQLQQKQIEALQKGQKQTEATVEKTVKQVKKAEKKVQNVEKIANAGSYSSNDSSMGWWDKTSLGGYGELHYNGGDTDEIDFHRFVLFVGHEFNDRLRFFSELEIEHALAGEGKPGEVELEQAFLEYNITDTQHAKAGLFLLPVGILNETHEPNTFYGVERNPIEKNIIPATWWEAGVGLNGELGEGFSYDVALHSGLNTPTTGSKTFNIRSGRQKVAKASAKDGAATGRIKWTGLPGVELATSLQYQQDVAQGSLTESADATLWETHAAINKNGFGLRALYARWDINGADAAAAGKDEQYGWYVEPSYRFAVTDEDEIGLFARYNEYDNSASTSTDTKFTQVDFGVNYWPHPNVVLKADYAILDNPSGTADDELVNLGVGFQF